MNLKGKIRDGIQQPVSFRWKVMKNAYPAFIRKDKDDYLVYLPDIDAYTSGKSFYDAIDMARDLLGMMSLETKLPLPGDPASVRKLAEEKADDPDFKFSDADITYVGIDTDAYKKKTDTKEKRICIVPEYRKTI